jgi:hypothetical protein
LPDRFCEDNSVNQYTVDNISMILQVYANKQAHRYFKAGFVVLENSFLDQVLAKTTLYAGSAYMDCGCMADARTRGILKAQKK